MVKSISESIEIHGLNVQDAFSLIYVDTHLLLKFHASVNQDENASVPAWSADNTRTLSFTTPINAPTFIAKMIGSNTILVEEHQSFSIEKDGSGIRIESIPVPQIPGASNFSSTATLVIHSKEDHDRCAIDATVQCIANGPFGLTSTIEKFMADSARASLLKFLNFCQEYINDMKHQEGMLPEALCRAQSLPGSLSGGIEVYADSRSGTAAQNAIVRDGASFELQQTLSPSTAVEIETLAPMDTNDDTGGLQGQEPAGGLVEQEDVPQGQFYDAHETLLYESMAMHLQHVSTSSDAMILLLQSIDSRVSKMENEFVLYNKSKEESSWRALLPEPPTARQAVWMGALMVVTAALTSLYSRKGSSNSSRM